MYTTHQCVRFAKGPRSSHSAAIIYLAKYLLGTADRGLILTPDKSKAIKLYVDANWSRNWRKKHSKVDGSTANSCTGFSLSFDGNQHWTSKLQTIVALKHN